MVPKMIMSTMTMKPMPHGAATHAATALQHPQEDPLGGLPSSMTLTEELGCCKLLGFYR